MAHLEFRVAVLVVAVVFIALTVFLSFFFRVDGSWKRADSDEVMTIRQTGPRIVSSVVVDGGEMKLSGWLFGPWLIFTRRDFGAEFLSRQGYPSAIAAKRVGEVSGAFRLRLRRTSTRETLDGVFIPKRVAFSRQPMRITGVTDERPRRRSYQRLYSNEETGLIV